MFNGFMHEKKELEKQIQYNQANEQTKIQRVLKKRNSILSEKYRDRIGTFIKKMLIEPTPQQDDYQERLRFNLVLQRFQQFTPNSFNQNRASTTSNRHGRNSKILSMIDYADQSLEETNSIDKPQLFQNIKIQNKLDRGFSQPRNQRPNEVKILDTTTRDSLNNRQSYLTNREEQNNLLQTFSKISGKSPQNVYLSLISSDASRRTNQGLRYTSTQHERVKLAQEQFANLDSQPTKRFMGITNEQIMNLRPREVEKEIGPPSFRFRAKNYIEKIVDQMSNCPISFVKTQDLCGKKIISKQGRIISNVMPIDLHQISVSKTQKSSPVANKNNKQSSSTTKDQENLKDDNLSQQAQQNNGKIEIQNQKISRISELSVIEPEQKKKNIKIKLVNPRDLLPTLHEKTHFKAATEYSIGDISRNVNNRQIELLIKEGMRNEKSESLGQQAQLKTPKQNSNEISNPHDVSFENLDSSLGKPKTFKSNLLKKLNLTQINKRLSTESESKQNSIPADFKINDSTPHKRPNILKIPFLSNKFDGESASYRGGVSQRVASRNFGSEGKFQAREVTKNMLRTCNVFRDQFQSTIN